MSPKGVVAAVLALALLPASAAAAAPSIDSTYGSGHFGTWKVDEFGLPAFRYALDQATDPRAKQTELAGSTLAQHQVGNDNVVAAAFNDGYTQLWSQARLSQWANLAQPGNRHYGGGFGWLNAGGGKVLSTLHPDRPRGAGFERDFGVGYFRKRLRADGLEVTQDTFAPYGDDPLLVDEVAIRNTTSVARRVSWFEYWDVNPYDQSTKRGIGTAAPEWDAATRTLSAAQQSGDTAPLSLFAAALRGPLDGYETSAGAFFGDGTRAEPAAVKADKLAGTSGGSGDTLFAFRAPVTVPAGGTVRLRYVYGLAHPEQIGKLVAKYRGAADPFAASERAWAKWAPQADFGATRRWVARELVWDAYLLRSATVFEEACGAHTITQGGYYQYDTGDNLGYRSWLHYLLPITYTNPDLAREILRYSIKLQPPGPAAAQQLPYGTGPLCTRFDLGTSNDLDFWLLLAAGEYGLGSRDLKFFDEQLPYYGTDQKASAWEHIKESFAHQESLIGPNGQYVMGSTGDWSDFSTQFMQMTESTLVTSQLAYAYPKLAELADARGDAEFAAQLRAAAKRALEALRGEWVGKGWYSRGYSGARQVGVGSIFEEPQPWAILAGAPSADQTRTLIANIRRFLDGIGAPPEVHGPARFGTAQIPGRRDPEVTELGPVATGVGLLPEEMRSQLPRSSLQGAAQWPGGVWFDLNGHLTWAYASIGQDELAWDEYTRNTLANHATLWPDHWAGTISVDDVCLGYYADHPEDCGTGLTTAYDGQITEQPTWMVMNAIRLAGVTPTRSGYDIDPHYPFERFSLRLPRIGVAREAGRLRGFVRPEGSGPITFAVHVPTTRPVTAWVGGRRTASKRDGSVVRFTADGRRGAAVDWALTWDTARCGARRGC